jgi:RNA polymerase sigma factor (sigma-70 family)
VTHAIGDPADDASLALRARDGDSDAFAVLVRRHQGVAVRMAALVGGADDAEDAAQEAFVKAYRALGRYQPDRAFRPWLMAIVCNEARNRQRSTLRLMRLRRRAAALTPMLVEPSAEESVVAQRRRAAAARAVERLPQKLRLAVTCRYLLELSEAETAEVLGCPTGTVKVPLGPRPRPPAPRAERRAGRGGERLVPTDDQLERTLRDLAGSLRVPADRDLAAEVMQRVGTEPERSPTAVRGRPMQTKRVLAIASLLLAAVLLSFVALLTLPWVFCASET